MVDGFRFGVGMDLGPVLNGVDCTGMDDGARKVRGLFTLPQDPPCKAKVPDRVSVPMEGWRSALSSSVI